MHTGRRLSPGGRWTRVQGYLAQPCHSLSEMCWKWWGMCPRYEGYVSDRNNSRSERCRNASKCKFPGSEAFWSYQRSSQNGCSAITVAPRQLQQLTQHQHDNMTTGGWKCAEKDGNPPERAWGQGNGHEAQHTRYTHFFSFFSIFYWLLLPTTAMPPAEHDLFHAEQHLFSHLRHIKHANTACLTYLNPPPALPCPSLILKMTNLFLNSTFLPIQDTSNMPYQCVWYVLTRPASLLPHPQNTSLASSQHLPSNI